MGGGDSPLPICFFVNEFTCKKGYDCRVMQQPDQNSFTPASLPDNLIAAFDMCKEQGRCPTKGVWGGGILTVFAPLFPTRTLVGMHKLLGLVIPTWCKNMTSSFTGL